MLGQQNVRRDKEHIIRLYSLGMSIYRLAQRYRVAQSTMNEFLIEWGVKDNNKKRRRERYLISGPYQGRLSERAIRNRKRRERYRNDPEFRERRIQSNLKWQRKNP
jgi:hypothetical protein